MAHAEAPEGIACRKEWKHTQRTERIEPAVAASDEQLQGVILHEGIGDHERTKAKEMLPIYIDWMLPMVASPIGKQIERT